MKRGLALAMALSLAGCAHAPPRIPLVGWLRDLPQDWAGPVAFVPQQHAGRVVLVTFIATWCFPCLTDLTSLTRLESEFGPRGFSNVVVLLDLEGHLVADPFAEEYQLPFPLVVGDDRLRSGRTYFGQVRELPTRVLLAADGRVVAGYTGIADFQKLQALIQRTLDERP